MNFIHSGTSDFILFYFMFFFFFLNVCVDHFKSLYKICYYTLQFYVLVSWPGDMWDLSSLTRDWTHTPCIDRQSINRWTTREALQVTLKAILVKLSHGDSGGIPCLYTNSNSSLISSTILNNSWRGSQEAPGSCEPEDCGGSLFSLNLGSCMENLSHGAWER